MPELLAIALVIICLAAMLPSVAAASSNCRDLLLGPESFTRGEAEYDGLAVKKGIKKGEGVDAVGRSIVYDCQLAN